MKREMVYIPLGDKHHLPRDRKRVTEQIMVIDPAQNRSEISKMPKNELIGMRNRLFREFDARIKPRKEVEELALDCQCPLCK